MRCGILISIIVLQLLAAGIMIAVGCRLPSPQVVGQRMERASQVSRSAESQVQLMRRQVDEVRHKDFPNIANRMLSQTAGVAAMVRAQRIDFETVEAMSSALGAVSKGLEGWSGNLDPEKYLSSAKALGATADALEFDFFWNLFPANEARGRSLRDLHQDFCQVVLIAQEQLKNPSNQEWANSIFQIVADLFSVCQSRTVEQFAEVHKQLRDLENVLKTACDQVEMVTHATYPVIMPSGFGPPVIESRPIWPEGAHTIESLHAALRTVETINGELEVVSGALPVILATIDEQRRHLISDSADANDTTAVRKVALATVLFLNRFLEESSAVPGMVFGLRTELDRLHEFAVSLRKTQRAIERTLSTWPELIKTMQRSAMVLDGSRKQLDTVLSQRSQYQQAMGDSEQLTRTSEDLLRSYTTKLEDRLGEQEQSLGQMESGLHEVNEAIPGLTHDANDLLSAIRWMFWLIGGLVGIHGLFMASEAYLKRS